MKLTEYECRINGIHIMEVKIDGVGQAGYNMGAVYATLEKTGDQQALTHGRCTAVPKNWSAETKRLMGELLLSMEQDLLPRHFKIPAGLEREDERTGPVTVEEVDQV